MVGIGVATAAAGIIVGTVAQTGLGGVMIELVEFLSGGNLIVMLVLTAVISLVLGLGLPTTANYIIVATLMAPIVVELGSQQGLIVPLIAVHLFVFYFGLMADVTPPVGLASFAAAAISRGDPLKTGVQAFYYCLRTVALPFIFVFNTQLAAHRRRRLGPSGPRGGQRHRGDAGVCRRDPELLHRAQPLVRDRGPAARRLHAVPARLLDGHDRRAVRPPAADRVARDRRSQRPPTASSGSRSRAWMPWGATCRRW
jgi:hypothetical protein